MLNEIRLKRLQSEMKSKDMKVFILTDPSSIAYLCDYVNHPGERCYALIIYQDREPIFFLNRLFPQPDFDIQCVWYNDEDSAVKMMLPLLQGYDQIAVDKSWESHFLLELQDLLKDVHFINGSLTIDHVRMIKDEEEIALMKASSLINDQAMKKMQEALSENLTESELGQRLNEFYRELGGESFSFGPIVAYGPHGANPHHSLSESHLQSGDSIIIDMGCMYQGYCSDMTRTFFYQNVSDKQKEVYHLVLEANQQAQAMIKPGVRLCDIDQKARDIITQGGYGPYFTHRLGHFIGRDVHEYGGVSAAFDMPVEEGMIFSIEPGIYLPGEFGVRIEDLVVVTKEGCESLNHFPKELMIIQ